MFILFEVFVDSEMFINLQNLHSFKQNAQTIYDFFLVLCFIRFLTRNQFLSMCKIGQTKYGFLSCKLNPWKHPPTTTTLWHEIAKSKLDGVLPNSVPRYMAYVVRNDCMNILIDWHMWRVLSRTMLRVPSTSWMTQYSPFASAAF